MKCSGDSPQCSRCDRESIRCVYSPQKQMGRPRKRRRDDVGTGTGTPAELSSENSRGSNPSSHETPNFADFSLINPMSQSDFPEFSGFADFQTNEAIVNPLGGPLGSNQPVMDATLMNEIPQGHSNNLEQVLSNYIFFMSNSSLGLAWIPQ